MNEMGKSDGLCKFDYVYSFIYSNMLQMYVFLYNFYDYMYPLVYSTRQEIIIIIIIYVHLFNQRLLSILSIID